MKKNLIVFILLTLVCSCRFKEKSNLEGQKSISKNDSLIVLLNQNIRFIKDSLFEQNSGVIDDYFSDYQLKIDSCGIIPQKTSSLKENFEGVSIIKRIRKNKQNDTVFVMPPFNYCDSGDSYAFFDKTLPRLQTDSYCCHPENLFVCPDIDEDGVNEIGIYYSSCTSRFKSLRIYTLRQNSWKKIATSVFDIFTKEPAEVNFSDLVKKVSKNKFQLCNFYEGKTKWEFVEMN